MKLVQWSMIPSGLHMTGNAYLPIKFASVLFLSGCVMPSETTWYPKANRKKKKSPIVLYHENDNDDGCGGGNDNPVI